MSYRLYNSGNVLTFINTAYRETLKDDVQFRVEKLPKNKTWYSYNNLDAPILYSVYFDNPERDLVLNAQYGEFQYEDGTTFSSDAELIAYLDNLLGFVDKSGLAIAKGDVYGHSVVHKFGAAFDFDTGDNEVTVWDGAEDGTAWELMNYVYSTTAAIDRVSSTNAGDSVDVEIQGLDANYDLVVQTITLNGTTPVALTTDLIRVFRVKNVGDTDLVGHVIVFENDTTNDDAGVPDDSNLIRAVVHPENNQTEMAVYTIPNGKTGYLRSIDASIGGASRTTNFIFKLFARKPGETFQLKKKFALGEGSTSFVQYTFEEPEKFTEKTDLEITAQISETNITGGSVVAGFNLVLVDV